MAARERSLSVFRQGAVAAGLLVALIAAAPLRAQVGELQSLGVSPALPTVNDSIVLHAETTCSNPFIGPPTIANGIISLSTYPGGLVPPCPPPGAPVNISWPLGKLAAGPYTIEVIVIGDIVATPPEVSSAFEVLPAATSADLLSSRFRVRVVRPGSSCGPGCLPAQVAQPAVRLADNAGAFSFTDSNNIEVVARVLDGRPVNGSFWVFVASLTDQGFIVTVSDLHNPALCAAPGSLEEGQFPPCLTKTYTSPPGVNQNIIDLDFFTSVP
jgi:hypothetical protein